MTIVLRMPDGVPLTAQQERQAWGAVHGGGSGRQLGGRSGFRVGTPSNVLTATSTTWTLGACSAMLDPGAQTHQGMYGWSNDTNVTGTVTAADATYDRKDIVYIQVNDSDMDTSGAKSAPVLYLAGTATANPQPPALPARSFLVGTITVPKAGGGSPTVARNTATYVAAGAPQPTYSDAERDALDKYDGLTVLCADIGGRPERIWNGAEWIKTRTERILTSTSQSDWAFNVTLTRHWNEDGTKSVSMGLIVARLNGTPFTVGTNAWTGLFPALIPAGWRPNDNIFTCGGYEFAPSGRVTGAVLIQVRTSGQVDAQGVTDTINMGAPTKITASAHWTAA